MEKQTRGIAPFIDKPIVWDWELISGDAIGVGTGAVIKGWGGTLPRP